MLGAPSRRSANDAHVHSQQRGRASVAHVHRVDAEVDRAGEEVGEEEDAKRPTIDGLEQRQRRLLLYKLAPQHREAKREANLREHPQDVRGIA